ncbi:MAG: GDSL-type esterase/lipase family protein [Thermoguttaceae bacterium]|jgi:lysophospholipase L1-like esterase
MHGLRAPILLGWLCLASAVVIDCDAALAQRQPEAAMVPLRIAFLGDSITDGYTYPQLVRDSLAKSRKIGVLAMNAGIGGDTMAGMEARLQRDVLDHHPDLVTISAGANDAGHGVTAQDYEKAMRAAVDAILARKVKVILLAPVWWPHKSPNKMDQYEHVIRRIAAEKKLPVAEVTRCMSADAAAGHPQHAQDGVHPNYTGQRRIARAVLDAMGYSDVPVVERVSAVLDPEVVRDWSFRTVGKSERPLTETTVAAVAVDASWKAVRVPIAKTDYTGQDWESLAWLDDFRREGMAIQLDVNVGPAEKFIGLAKIPSDRERSVVLQTGGDVSVVWLNGKQVCRNEWLRGWHPGRDATPVALRSGTNTLVVETGRNCWIRISAKPLW